MTTKAKGTVGAVLVVGGGIAGLQAALDAANAGLKVYLVEKDISLGGMMAKLDKTFPTNDCSTCMISPKLIEVGLHPDIEVITQADVESLSGTPGDFTVTLTQAPRYIDLAKCTACGDCAKVCPVTMPSTFDEGLGTRQAAYRHFPQTIPSQYAIKKLGRPPCVTTCPAGLKVQGYIQLIKVGRYEEAVRLIMEELPLPGVIGRVCPHPCESACRRAEVDEALAICDLKRFAADQVDLDTLPLPKVPLKRKKVAVIGSGPAGLSCAYHLARRGYPCTIFEALPVTGGMLRVGIPDHRLPKEVLDREIAYIQRWGVKIVTNTALGRDITLDGLFQEGYRAVFLGLGCHAGMPLGIPGEEADGVLEGVELLRTLALGEPFKPGRKVLVVGGGYVALDVARTVRRLGAEVTIIYRRSRKEMPAAPEEVLEAEREGVRIEFLAAPQEVVVVHGAAAGLRCLRMTLGEPDASGRRRPLPLAGSEFILNGDMIVAAVGQRPDLTGLESAGIQTTRWGTIDADPVTFMTSRPGVFAAGDVQVGPWIAIGAVAGGREAAESIDRYLQGKDLAAGRGPSLGSEVQQRWVDIRPTEKKRPREPMPLLPVAACLAGFAEVRQGYTPDQAHREAERCLNCAICSECMQCVAACKPGAVDHEQQPRKMELRVGAVILAPGYRPFDARRKVEYGYGRYANVVTALEFERLLAATGPTRGRVQRPSDGNEPKKIAWLQCVGSRDQAAGRDYCSSVCCMYATKQALVAREHDAQVEAAIFYIDLRAQGKGFDRYYERAQDSGVRYIRSLVSRVAENPRSKNLEISYVDPGGQIRVEEFDLVVLSVGLDAHPEAVELGRRLELAVNPWHFATGQPLEAVASSRPGVYVCGVYQSPQDIPETVTQASAAAASAASLLADSRGTLVTAKAYPPERDIAGEEPRVGVFVCHCGINIAGVVDVPAVTDYARTLPQVVHADHLVFSCATDSLEQIRRAVREHGLNRVVVAACSPRTHEPLFQENLRQAGLNKYLFEMANIRDQDAWVHQGEPERATALAQDLIRMAVGRARNLEPFQETRFQVVPRGLIVGGGLAGLSAALTLAEAGYECTIVEQQPEPGGLARLPHQTSDGLQIRDYLETVATRVQNHPRIQILTDARVVDFRGHVGRFISVVRTAAGERLEIPHGATILAPGAVEYRPTEYLYGQSERVLTHMELEDRLAAGRQFPPGSTVVQILCVGSREPEHPYCSRVCCTNAVNDAIRLQELDPGARNFILYRDIRTFGFHELAYQKARKLGVQFIRFDRGRPPEVTLRGAGLQVNVFDQSLGAPLAMKADYLILAAAFRPSPGLAEAARVYKLATDADGFLLEAHVKLRPLDLAGSGFFLAGMAHAPKFPAEVIAQGQGAAARAMGILARQTMEVSGQVASVDQGACVRCLNCLRVCPYGAPYFQEDVARVAIDPTTCQGCGICCATCPALAIDLQHSRDRQFHGMLNAI